uniref:HTH_48 domain-containing protein n=1 Tax=Heligmosomoides polygyrus TaxID=6339 RepID=A0A183FKR0_HELPZ
LVAAFDEDLVFKRQCKRWFQRFAAGDESLEDEEHGRQAPVLASDLSRTAVEADPTRSTRELAVAVEPHVAKVVQQKIEKLGWTVLPYPLHRHCPIRLSHIPLDAARLGWEEVRRLREIRIWVTNFLDSQSAHFFQDGIQSLLVHWTKVVYNRGGYITKLSLALIALCEYNVLV